MSGNIGCDQNIEVVMGKFFENVQMFFLCYVVGQQIYVMVVGGEMVLDIFVMVFGIGENDGVIGLFFFQQCLQQVYFFFVGWVEEFFFNMVVCFLFWFDFNVFGVIYLFECQFVDVIRKGCGEQYVQVLSGWWYVVEQLVDIFNKVEIVYVIGFVQYDNLNGVEVNVVLFCVIDQMISGVDQNIDVVFQYF